MEIRAVAGGYRMATKPEHHDVVRSFAKSLKPPIRLSLQALETLAVIAYKQPVTAPEISEIRGVDSQGVLATLIDRKLITTAGRKQVIGRPILYKTTKEFLMRFGLKDVTELPSMEEFEKLISGQEGLFSEPAPEAKLLRRPRPPQQKTLRQRRLPPKQHQSRTSSPRKLLRARSSFHVIRFAFHVSLSWQRYRLRESRKRETASSHPAVHPSPNRNYPLHVD